MKVTRIGDVMARKIPFTLRNLSSQLPYIKIVLRKLVALIMRIINIIINMENNRQKRPNEGPISKLNETLNQKSLKQILHNRQRIYRLLVLEKINIVAFLEVKLVAENPRKGWKTEYFPKVEAFLIQKCGNISKRCLVVAKTFLVCQPKSGAVLGPKGSSSWITQNCFLHNKS